MNQNHKEWLETAKANKVGDSWGLCKWTLAMVKAAKLSQDEKDLALLDAMKIIKDGGLRGDISDCWRDLGMSNEQFNFELFV